MRNIVLDQNKFDFFHQYYGGEIPPEHRDVILSFFKSFIVPNATAMSIDDFPPTIDIRVIDRGASKLFLKGDIHFQGPEISKNWLAYLSGAMSFDKIVKNHKDGDKLYRKAYRILGYNAKEWREEEYTEPIDLFLEHGLGFEYNYVNHTEVKFDMVCNQDNWRIPKDLVVLIKNDVEVTAKRLLDEFDLDGIYIYNWSGIFEISLEFTWCLSPESVKNENNLLVRLINKIFGSV